jgi:hypothetical protein
MVQSWDRNRLFQRALAASLGMHLLFAAFLPTWRPAEDAELQSVETLSFARVLHIQIVRPATHAPPPAIERTPRREARVSFARNRAELSTPRRTPVVRPTAQNGPSGRHAAAPRMVAAQAMPVYAQAPSHHAVAAQVSRPAPSPAPYPTQGPVAQTGDSAQNRGGMLPWGAEQPPTLDPRVLARLEQLAVHVTLRVVVGEDGKTKRVEFDSPIDPQLANRIQVLLAQANWDAAVCGGGVSCEQTATIKL